VIIDCASYRDGHRVTGAADFSDALEEARGAGAPDSFVWIGLHEPTEEEFASVSSEFGLHPLAAEDALRAHQRPKLEVYEGSVFLVLKPVNYDDRADTVSTGELMVFLGDSFVVTVRHGEHGSPGVVRKRLEQDPELLRRGPSAVVYAIADAVVDHYLEVSDQLQVDLEELEAEVFRPEAGRTAQVGASGGTAGRIYGFKRQVLEFRRATAPLLQPMLRLTEGQVPYLAEANKPFFRDVSDHLTRASEQVEALDRLLSDILSAHLTQVSVQQNDDMRKISAWAAMAVVPTVVAGIYGMNFEHMPELRFEWGYPAALALILVVVGLLYRWFRRRDWL
jgi:magnesium transporter